MFSVSSETAEAAFEGVLKIHIQNAVSSVMAPRDKKGEAGPKMKRDGKHDATMTSCSVIKVGLCANNCSLLNKVLHSLSNSRFAQIARFLRLNTVIDGAASPIRSSLRRSGRQRSDKICPMLDAACHCFDSVGRAIGRGDISAELYAMEGGFWTLRLLRFLGVEGSCTCCVEARSVWQLFSSLEASLDEEESARKCR